MVSVPWIDDGVWESYGKLTRTAEWKARGRGLLTRVGHQVREPFFTILRIDLLRHRFAH
jgi:hypothetical protein